MTTEHHPRLGTLSVWGGEEEYLVQGATQVPVVHSVSFGYDDVEEWLQVALGQKPGHIYSRNTNPTVQVFENKVRRLEGAEAAVSFASGMAATHCVVATLQAAIALSGFELTSHQFIDLCGEGEWFVGSRGGAGDHIHDR